MLAILAVAAAADDPCKLLPHPTTAELLPAPANASAHAAWLASLIAFRETCLASVGWPGNSTGGEALRWTRTSFVQPQMHPYDRGFYDPKRGYTVDAWLDGLEARYGGIDSALVWPTYTNIGIDERSQFDYVLAMPGGAAALANVSAALHARGVRALWPYNPWDTGTRRDAYGRSDAAILAALDVDTGFDGFNGDTMTTVPEAFYDASVEAGRPGAVEPEVGGDAAELAWGTLGWGYWAQTMGEPSPEAPPVDRWKWLDRRRLTHVCNRWAKDHADDLQFAWFNADGFEAWENVWGVWNGLTPRDAEALRRVATMLRFFGARNLTWASGWVPHAPVGGAGVYASLWPTATEALWTLVGRGAAAATARVDVSGRVPEGGRVYDCYGGAELDVQGGAVEVAVEAGGFGCVWATEADGRDFLATMAAMTARPLGDYGASWVAAKQTRAPTPATTPTDDVERGMTRVPSAVFRYRVAGVQIEAFPDQNGVDVQFPWEPAPTRSHDQLVTVDAFDVDTYPVTNADYDVYLAESGYLPENAYNWLKTWAHPRNDSAFHRAASAKPAPPPGAGKRPVVHVGLEEARAYCAHRGKRLPTDAEWQYAAQGLDGRAYPWGDADDASRRPPLVDDAAACPPRSDVDAYPSGASPFGVLDMAGNVWQYTDEFFDDHTRGVLVRGSANYRPGASTWYFPRALRNDQHNKYFLMDASYERASTVGFRCARAAPADDRSAAADCVPGAGALCLRLHPPAAFVDFDGAAAWIHCGLAGTACDRKAKATANLTHVSGEATSQFTNNPSAFSWTGGEPTKRTANTTHGVFATAGSLARLEATAPEGSVGELTVFAGAYYAAADFTVSAGGESRAIPVAAPDGLQTVAFTVKFTGTLATSWTLTDAFPSTDAPNINFQAAALKLA